MAVPAMQVMMAAGGVAAGFDPTTITGCTLWLDAADTATIGEVTGNVHTWTDKAGFGVSSITGTAYPVTGTRTQNGLNVLDFQGGDALANNTAPGINNASSGAWTIFAVALTDTTSGVRNIVDGDYSTPRVGQYIRINGATPESIGFNASGTPAIDTAATVSTATPYLFRTVNTGTAVELFIDGTSAGSTALPSGTQKYQTPNRLTVGALQQFGTGIVQFWDGWIAEIVAYNVALAGGDITTVENALTDKWGL